MFTLPFIRSKGGDSDHGRRRPPQPYSRNSLDKHARTRGATVTHSICPYCAVGCSTNIYTKGKQVIDIEGNPDSPINEGTLCPKGANIFQLHHNPHRLIVKLFFPQILLPDFHKQCELCKRHSIAPEDYMRPLCLMRKAD